MSEDLKSEQQLASMLVPLTDSLLLVPGTVIAEIIGWQQPEPVEGKPDWYLGEVSWRGLKLPLVSFERAGNGTMKERAEETRLAIVNGISGKSELPFYALIIQGIPRTLRLSGRDVTASEQSAASEIIKMHVKASGATAAIPDLDKLEDLLTVNQ
ncbi:chemotaxis protein CheW [Parendozoicomonas haliclonae]|uniref:CheW-like domain protein n=1 Tax=Parendozoicomonas haliclonae TaxID=1960125 RepID=A0A1X7AJ68_9GAMM|nr:chemotaxis protein CheW [Parendozoicomonas haliclonae]SMA46070.1 CheW-like domain protein [Parendozoicomonas haliclonae]